MAELPVKVEHLSFLPLPAQAEVVETLLQVEQEVLEGQVVGVLLEDHHHRAE